MMKGQYDDNGESLYRDVEDSCLDPLYTTLLLLPDGFWGEGSLKYQIHERTAVQAELLYIPFGPYASNRAVGTARPVPRPLAG